MPLDIFSDRTTPLDGLRALRNDHFDEGFHSRFLEIDGIDAFLRGLSQTNFHDPEVCKQAISRGIVSWDSVYFGQSIRFMILFSGKDQFLRDAFTVTVHCCHLELADYMDSITQLSYFVDVEDYYSFIKVKMSLEDFSSLCSDSKIIFRGSNAAPSEFTSVFLNGLMEYISEEKISDRYPESHVQADSLHKGCPDHEGWSYLFVARRGSGHDRLRFSVVERSEDKKAFVDELSLHLSRISSINSVFVFLVDFFIGMNFIRDYEFTNGTYKSKDFTYSLSPLGRFVSGATHQASGYLTRVLGAEPTGRARKRKAEDLPDPSLPPRAEANAARFKQVKLRITEEMRDAIEVAKGDAEMQLWMRAAFRKALREGIDVEFENSTPVPLEPPDPG